MVKIELPNSYRSKIQKQRYSSSQYIDTDILAKLRMYSDLLRRRNRRINLLYTPSSSVSSVPCAAFLPMSSSTCSYDHRNKTMNVMVINI